MSVCVVEHPLIKHKLGLMREHHISVKDFRDIASELASLLTFEATKDLETEKRTIRGWAGEEVLDMLGQDAVGVDLALDGIFHLSIWLP